MTLRNPATWMASGTHQADADRHYTAAMLGSPAAATPAAGTSPTNVGGGHGVMGDGDMKVSWTSGTRAVSVAAGHAFVRGATTAAQGVYGAWNDGAVTLNLENGDANPRYDVVALKLTDADPGVGNTTTAVSYVVVKGTAAASPADPAFPSDGSYLPLARVRVPSGTWTTTTGAMIDDLRPRATALGGVRKVRSTSLPTANLNEGDLAYCIDNGNLLRWSATQSAWVHLTPYVNPSSGGFPATTYPGQYVLNPQLDDRGMLPTFWDGTNWLSMGRGALQWQASAMYFGDMPSTATLQRAPLIVQSGTIVVPPSAPTDATGSFTIPFPRTFPNGVISVVVSFGDTAGISIASANGSTNYAGIIDVSRFTLQTHAPTASNTRCRVRISDGVYVGGAHTFRVNWIATGW